MKVLNKLWSVAIASILVLSLSGCEDKIETKVFTTSEGGVDVTSTVTYKGDKVLRQKSVSKIYYSTIGASTKQDAVSIIEPLREMFRNVAGLEESITFGDSYAEEIVDVDLEKADLHALKKLMGAKISGDLSKGVSMKKTQEQLESMGFTEVK